MISMRLMKSILPLHFISSSSRIREPGGAHSRSPVDACIAKWISSFPRRREPSVVLGHRALFALSSRRRSGPEFDTPRLGPGQRRDDKAGSIAAPRTTLDSRLRGNDGLKILCTSFFEQAILMSARFKSSICKSSRFNSLSFKSSRFTSSIVRSSIAGSLLLMFFATAFAKEAVPEAADPALEARMMRVTSELRCLVCQNQTIADSHADLAVDLRNQVREQLRAGRSDAEIIDYMTARYGDFVLYRPPFKPITVLLWLGPALMLGGGLLVLALVLRRRSRLPQEAFEPDDDDVLASSHGA